MMTLLMALTTLVAVLFLASMSPLTLTLVVISSAILSSTLIFNATSNLWLPFMLTLIFISAMMVLFTYLASLILHQALNKGPYYNKFSLVLLMALLLFSWAPFFLALPARHLNLTPKESSFTISNLFNTLETSITILLISYLLITLIAAVKTSTLHSQTPMRLKS